MPGLDAMVPGTPGLPSQGASGIDYASLLQTLSGLGTFGLSDAQSAQDQQQIQQAVQHAADAASQAGQQYQQAAQGPVPQVDPLSAVIGTSLGNAASVLSQNPAYSQRAHEDLVRQQAQLAQKRVENLQALRDNYDQKARAAERAQDLQLAGEMRLKQEQVSKTLSAILNAQKGDIQSGLLGQRGENQLAGIKARGAEQRTTNAALEPGKNYRAGLSATGGLGGAPGPGGGKGGAVADNPAIEGQVREDTQGNKYLDLSEFDAKQRAGVMAYAQQKGYLALRNDEAKSLQGLDHSVQNISDVEDAIKEMKPVKDFMGRPMQIAKVTWAKATQDNPAIASYPALQLSAINNLLAQVPPGRGFRANEAEIRRSINNDFPKDTDTLPVAKRKLNHQRQMLENLRNTVTVKNRSTLKGGINAPAAGSATGGAQPSQSDQDYVKSLGLKP